MLSQVLTNRSSVSVLPQTPVKVNTFKTNFLAHQLQLMSVKLSLAGIQKKKPI